MVCSLHWEHYPPCSWLTSYCPEDPPNRQKANTNEEAKRNLDLVSGNNAAYSNETSDALDSRYLHPEERELADKLAEESGGELNK